MLDVIGRSILCAGCSLAVVIGPALLGGQTMAQEACPAVEQNGAKGETPSHAALAHRWAPIHYQDTDSSYPSGDYLSAVDFDGDWQADNNWDNQARFGDRLRGVVYYSVVEAPTHWFIVYAMYHPRDWTDLPPIVGRSLKLTHENDMEGLLAVVAKGQEEPLGRLEALVTVAHREFYSFLTRDSTFGSGQETIDGPVIMEWHEGVARPTTFQEAKGHGLKAWNGRNFPGRDGVRYVPGLGPGSLPRHGNDRAASYELRDVFATGGLWDHRQDPTTFASWGRFRGNHGRQNAANAPWGWVDHNDGLDSGLLALDPARLVLEYFTVRDPFDATYTCQPYQARVLELSQHGG